MIRKKHLWIPLTLMLLTSIAMVGMPVKASSTVKIYTVPGPPVYIPGVTPPGFVDVEVRIESPPGWNNTAEGIVAWTMNVTVDPTVLEPVSVLSAAEGYVLWDFIYYYGHGGHEPALLYTVDKPAGKFIGVVEVLKGYETLGLGVGGNGLLCTLRFKSLSETAPSLIELTDVYYQTLAGKFPADIVGNGHYNPTPWEARLAGKSAWPEHKHFVIAKDGDELVDDRHGTPGYQSLYGRIKNTGTANVTVKMGFELLGPTPVPDVYTDNASIAPGEIITLRANCTKFTELDVGKWDINASCWYYNPHGKIWESGVKNKTSGFSVVAGK